MKYSRSLVATLLMSGGLLQLAPLAFAAAPTPAGNTIDNTANATYEDSNTPTGTTPTIINTTSNTVTVTVAIVAGITVTPDTNKITAYTTTGSAAIIPGNDLYYNFVVTNTGNYKTKIHIPSVATISNTGTLKTTTAIPTGVEYSTDNGASWSPVGSGGIDTLSFVNPGDKVLVRVGVTVNSNTGTTLDVRLGNTPGNNSLNENYLPNGAEDVYTLIDPANVPANLQRESSAIVSGTIGTTVATVTNAAFATVLLTRNTPVAGQITTPSTLNDDVITYKLKLQVESSAPTSATGITAADLTGTTITTDIVGGTSAKRILISSAVPAGTAVEDTPNTIAGWTKVYTISDPTTVKANEAVWTTVYTAAAKRVGFVSNVGATLQKGESIDNLTFAVKVTAATGTTYTVNSIAQAFGSTLAGSDLIYDESGDQTPNNYDTTKPLVTSTFSTTTGTGTVYTTGADGVAVATYNVDGGNNNTGTGDGRGEINKYSYTYTASGLLNGPKDVPEAEGITAGVGDNNADFTNKSSAVPAGKVAGTSATIGSLLPVGFTNTVQNKGTATVNINLLPEELVAGDLPNNTTVRIYDDVTTQTATYTLTSGSFNLTSGTAVVLTNVLANEKRSYSVEVTLPIATLLSTDTLKGYPVAIKAFTGPVGAITASNKTIDRVYNGFIKMTKETRILQGTGPVVIPGQENFSATDKKPGLGNIIEYRVTYKNISEAQTGSGNVVLGARNLVITEDGTSTAASGNKWARDFNGDNTIDTSHVLGSVAATGTVQYFTGTAGTSSLTAEPATASTSVNTDVTKYINTVSGTVAPGVSGTFTFQRKLN
jgi:hypothetical protein